MKRFIAFSGGVESTAMCVLWGNVATAIFTDTGWEHKPMYTRLKRCEKKLSEVHANFKFKRVVRINKKTGKEETLPEYIEKSGFFPAPLARYCTKMFKIEPMDDFLSTQGECELFIGFNADETPDERVGNLMKCKNVKYRYPLRENGITRAACYDIIRRVGLEPSDLPAYMTRGGCKGCFYKRKAEFMAMRLLAPDEFAEVEDLEKRLQDRRSKFYTIEANGNSMESMRIQADQMGMMFSPEEMYGEQVPHTPCGAFCHR